MISLPRNIVSLPDRQHGVATLVTALVLLLGITILTFASARVITTEHKIAANDYRAKQALEAAQAGMEVALYNANTNPGGIVSGTLVNNPNSSPVRYNYVLNTVGGSSEMLFVTATGYSDDQSASRALTQYLKYLPKHKWPQDTLACPKKIHVKGDVTVVNTVTNRTATSGESVKTKLLNNETDSDDADDDDEDRNDDSVNRNQGSIFVTDAGSNVGTAGISQNYPAYAGDTTAEFFGEFFNDSMAAVKAGAVQINCPSDCSSTLAAAASANPGKILYLNTDGGNGKVQLKSPATIGSASAPVTIIVDGHLKFKSAATVYGFIFATKKIQEHGDGSLTLVGSLAAREKVKIHGKLNDNDPRSTLTYADKPANTTSLVGHYVKVSGTWTD